MEQGKAGKCSWPVEDIESGPSLWEGCSQEEKKWHGLNEELASIKEKK